MISSAADSVFPVLGAVGSGLSGSFLEMYHWQGYRYLRIVATEELLRLSNDPAPCIGGINSEVVDFWRNRR